VVRLLGPGSIVPVIKRWSLEPNGRFRRRGDSPSVGFFRYHEGKDIEGFPNRPGLDQKNDIKSMAIEGKIRA
jgi:hypothetical protein